jgi:hypothetical protein
MGVEIEDVDMGYEDIINSIVEGNEQEVEIGFYSDQKSGEFTLAELATVHEFGKGNIPKRPFMRRSFDKGLSDWEKMNKDLIGSLIDGKIDKETVLEVSGDFHKNQIQQGVINQTLGLRANADITIERKGSETPLIDTGRLINGAEVRVENG